MSRLRFLNASDNGITGTVPPSIGGLQDLVELALFENQISGSLPLELGSIWPLRAIRMENNRLNGNLTEFRTLGNLRNLVTLDLYNNHMYGDLPASLQNLTALQYLYLDNQHYRILRNYYCVWFFGPRIIPRVLRCLLAACMRCQRAQWISCRHAGESIKVLALLMCSCRLVRKCYANAGRTDSQQRQVQLQDRPGCLPRDGGYDLPQYA